MTAAATPAGQPKIPYRRDASLQQGNPPVPAGKNAPFLHARRPAPEPRDRLRRQGPATLKARLTLWADLEIWIYMHKGVSGTQKRHNAARNTKNKQVKRL